MIKKRFYFILVGLFFYNCEPIHNNPAEAYKIENYSTYGDTFKALWRTIDDNYPFDLDAWDEIYHKYAPQFEALPTGLDKEGAGVVLAHNEAKANLLFNEVLEGNIIIDGHFVFSFNNNNKYKPKSKRDREESRGTEPSSPLSYVDSFPSGFKKNQENYFTSSESTKILSGTFDNGRIAYLHLDNFALKQLYEKKDPRISELISWLGKISRKNDNLGIILDLRNNNGGRVEDIDFFISRFLIREVTYAKSRIRKGPGFREYYPWSDEKIFPKDDEKERFPFKKIAVLINRKSASMAETSSAILAGESSGRTKLIGENSAGMFSPIFGREVDEKQEVRGRTLPEVFNMGGNYEFGQRGKLWFSIQMGVAAMRVFNPASENYEILEGEGLSPHEPVSGDVEQLRAAINYLREN